jgi:MHS family proline/betaine transporter-like MFS transporter
VVRFRRLQLHRGDTRKVFFPTEDPAAQLLSALVTFEVASLSRPVGAAFFGPLGDRIGRQRVLAATMLLIAIGTFSIGLIPSHQRIGILAPILLLLARLVQGFSTGGEYGGATTFIAEFAPVSRFEPAGAVTKASQVA